MTDTELDDLRRREEALQRINAALDEEIFDFHSRKLGGAEGAGAVTCNC